MHIVQSSCKCSYTAFWTRLNQRHTAKCLLDNSPTNQLAISQDAV